MVAISLLALCHPVAASLRGSIFPSHPVACPRDPEKQNFNIYYWIPWTSHGMTVDD
ncbi:MAG TPA: hypothetical protein LFV90_00415 [Rickettsia endosymbiont of Columbicola hoogstraali]|nr:hypothetical protein [Rickettsia endosymbiont of Columbicola hoogstraali]